MRRQLDIMQTFMISFRVFHCAFKRNLGYILPKQVTLIGDPLPGLLNVCSSMYADNVRGQNVLGN